MVSWTDVWTDGMITGDVIGWHQWWSVLTLLPSNGFDGKTTDGAVKQQFSWRRDTDIWHAKNNRRSIDLNDGRVFYSRDFIDGFTGKDASVFIGNCRQVQMAHDDSSVVTHVVSNSNVTKRGRRLCRWRVMIVSGRRRVTTQQLMISIPTNLRKRRPRSRAPQIQVWSRIQTAREEGFQKRWLFLCSMIHEKILLQFSKRQSNKLTHDKWGQFHIKILKTRLPLQRSLLLHTRTASFQRNVSTKSCEDTMSVNVSSQKECVSRTFEENFFLGVCPSSYRKHGEKERCAAFSDMKQS